MTIVLDPIFASVENAFHELFSLETLAHELDPLLDSLAFELDSLDKQDIKGNIKLFLNMTCTASVIVQTAYQAS